MDLFGKTLDVGDDSGGIGVAFGKEGCSPRLGQTDGGESCHEVGEDGCGRLFDFVEGGMNLLEAIGRTCDGSGMISSSIGCGGVVHHLSGNACDKGSNVIAHSSTWRQDSSGQMHGYDDIDVWNMVVSRSVSRIGGGW